MAVDALVAAVVLNYNGAEITLRCVESLLCCALPDGWRLGVLVVDNASTDSSVRELRAALSNTVELIEHPVNGGYGPGNNVGIRRALELGAEKVLVVNNDAMLRHDALEELLSVDEALCTPTIVDAGSGTVWYAGGHLSRWACHTVHEHWGDPVPGPDTAQATGFASGCALMFSADALRRLGGFDESLFLYWEDAELSERYTAAGSAPVWVPSAVVEHWPSSTTGSSRGNPTMAFYSTRNRLWFLRRHRPAPQMLVGVLLTPLLLVRTFAQAARRGNLTRGDVSASIRGLLRGMSRVPEPKIDRFDCRTSHLSSD